MTRQLCLLIFIALLFAACGTPQESADLPTLAEFPTASATPRPSETLPATFTLIPTETETPTATPTGTLSITPSATITDTPTSTPTDTPTFTPAPPDNDAISALVELAAQATILPPDFVIPPQTPGALPVSTPLAGSCSFPPSGGFNAVYISDLTLARQIGCPLGAPPTPASYSSAYQPFERGGMIWLQGAPNLIYVLSNNGRFQRFDDTYNASTDPISGGETPPSGLREPVRGFGKVWRQNPNIRADLGWGVTDEMGNNATILRFDRGQMMYLPQRGEILVLVEDPGGLAGSWRAFAGSY